LARKEKRKKQGGVSPQLPTNGEERRNRKKIRKQVKKKFDDVKSATVEDAIQEREGHQKILVDLVTAALKLGQSLEGSGDISTLISQVLQVVKAHSDKLPATSVPNLSTLSSCGDYKRRSIDNAEATGELTVDVIQEEVSSGDSEVEKAEATAGVTTDASKERPSSVDFEVGITESTEQTEVALLETPMVVSTTGKYIFDFQTDIGQYIETDQSAIELLDPRGSCPHPILREEEPGDDVSPDYWCGKLLVQMSHWVVPGWLVRELVITVKRWWRLWGAAWVRAKVFTENRTDSIDTLNRECKQVALSTLHAVESKLFELTVIGCSSVDLFDALKDSMRCYLSNDCDIHHLAHQAARLDEMLFEHRLIGRFHQWYVTQ
jgi:hypothetical protein